MAIGRPSCEQSDLGFAGGCHGGDQVMGTTVLELSCTQNPQSKWLHNTSM